MSTLFFYSLELWGRKPSLTSHSAVPDNCSEKVNSETAAAWQTGMEDNAAPVTFMGGAAQHRRHTNMTPHPERSNAGQAAKVFLTQTLPMGRQISRGNST